jgi:uncharacterized protein (TIGR00296 family)
LPFELNQKEGETLVKLARTAVEECLRSGRRITIPDGFPKKLMERCGVFVTINIVRGKEKELRGCIGLPYPTTPLGEAVLEAAIESATQDPRFTSLTQNELENVVFEVSILTPPRLVETLNPKEYLSKIKVGEDGLIIERGMYKGLLLPQVPVEWQWDCQEFLCQCCMKAGLPPDNWLLKDTKIYKFQCVIAHELSPKGPVEVCTSAGQKIT